MGDVALCNHHRNKKLHRSPTIFKITTFYLKHDCTTTRQKSKEHLDISPSKQHRKQVECDIGKSCNIHQAGEGVVSSGNII